MKKTTKTHSKLDTSSEVKMYENMGQMLDQPRERRQYEDPTAVENDTTNLVYQLAVFDVNKNQILKIRAIDFVAGRYDCTAETKSIWLAFPNGKLFNFMDEVEFDKYYEIYASTNARPTKKSDMLNWLKQSWRQLANMKPKPVVENTNPMTLNNKRP